MKNVLSTILTFSILFLSMSLAAQNCKPAPACKAAEPFNRCAAAFLNSNMLVDDYSPNGICKVEAGMRGTLTVSAVELSTNMAIPVGQVGFKVAIKNDKTNTLWLFSEETFQEIELEKIMAKCQPGDKIMLITVNPEFSLPHHEIDIVWGC